MLSGELGDAAERQALLDVRASNTADLLEQYRAAEEDLRLAREAAVDAAARAASQRNVVEEQLAAVQRARDEQAALAAQVQLQLDEALQEARRLAEQEASLDQQEAQREAELAAQREAERLARIQRQLEQASARQGAVNVPSHGTIELVSVGGIVVNAQIASQLEALLQAAAADGIVFTGGGYRDSAQQIALRRAHCGSSSYAIYQMSPSACRPPTARPGQSLHEQGLAIDFRANGRSITSRGSAGFRWLAANAASYGLYNLPSEPWHWSVTGG
jgi:LAS superfamily LD-carboxypeptidase LdcB